MSDRWEQAEAKEMALQRSEDQQEEIDALREEVAGLQRINAATQKELAEQCKRTAEQRARAETVESRLQTMTALRNEWQRESERLFRSRSFFARMGRMWKRGARKFRQERNALKTELHRVLYEVRQSSNEDGSTADEDIEVDPC